MLSLDGLSVGDAFGQSFFSYDQVATPERIAGDQIPDPPWRHTDDTEMAVVLVEALALYGHVEQEALALAWARRYMNDPYRSYGRGAQQLLTAIYAGEPWQPASRALFGGAGSMGNGSAMRVAPLGAYFADDVPRLIEQAQRSAEITHSHPEGVAGAIAVALAAAYAWNHRGQVVPATGGQLLEFVHDQTPASAVRDGVARAIELPRSESMAVAARALGNGSHVTCADTVPLCLWTAAKYLDDYRLAMWHTVTAGGDIDTNCAIVGGIVALSSSAGIPAAWLAARGPLHMR
jgi:ADP-ribosylglycohydrolase